MWWYHELLVCAPPQTTFQLIAGPTKRLDLVDHACPGLLGRVAQYYDLGQPCCLKIDHQHGGTSSGNILSCLDSDRIGLRAAIASPPSSSAREYVVARAFTLLWLHRSDSNTATGRLIGCLRASSISLRPALPGDPLRQTQHNGNRCELG